MKLPLFLFLALSSLMPFLSLAIIDITKVRQLAKQKNVTCILVFGDSSVDPGNNNILQTNMKGNFPPYGRDFFGHRPTGRFSNGRLATDFIAEALGYTKAIPAFLDPTLKPADLLHGVSFASAASGYDDFTANLSNVIPVSKQLEYFLHYKLHLSKLVGGRRAQTIIKNAVFVMSMGTNDFLQDYYLDPTRPAQYTIQQYLNYLIGCLSRDIEVMRWYGARRLVVVGVPPLGCMPLVKTIKGTTGCYEEYNKLSSSFNSRIIQKLVALRSTGMSTAFVDAYGIMMRAIKDPKKYGLTETTKGCCGTGIVEYGDSCKGLSTCSNPSQYVFWDAVHPTETMYKIIAEEAIASITRQVMRWYGARRLVVVGVPPLGCMPLVKTIKGTTGCYEEYNKLSSSFNSRIIQKLVALRSTGMGTAFVDAYGIIMRAIKDPKKYGLIETTKGCCGTGIVEYGDSCKGLSTCANPSQYVFWDAVHPTETMYKIIAEEAIASITRQVLG